MAGGRGSGGGMSVIASAAGGGAVTGREGRDGTGGGGGTDAAPGSVPALRARGRGAADGVSMAAGAPSCAFACASPSLRSLIARPARR